MEKYKLDSNIIITTRERYEKKFKALGYEPYKEKVSKVEEAIEQEEKVARRKKRKED